MLAFNEHSASEHALVRGDSSDLKTTAMVSHDWGAATAARASIWQERVPSAANLADAISREDFVYAISVGWVRYFPDFSKLWPVLLEVTRPPFDFSPQALQKIMEASKP